MHHTGMFLCCLSISDDRGLRAWCFQMARANCEVSSVHRSALQVLYTPIRYTAVQQQQSCSYVLLYSYTGYQVIIIGGEIPNPDLNIHACGQWPYTSDDVPGMRDLDDLDRDLSDGWILVNDAHDTNI